MDRIEALFPAYSPEDRALVRAAYDIASKALEDMKRGNGAPFIEHAENLMCLEGNQGDRHDGIEDSAYNEGFFKRGGLTHGQHII